MKNNEIRWAGRVYRHAAGDDTGDGGGSDAGGSGDDGSGAAASGDQGAGDTGDAGAGDAGGDGSGDGGESWRDHYLGFAPEGEDYAGLVNRFTTEEDFVRGAVQAHAKLRAGEVSTGLPDNPTEEQLAEFREAQGVPVDGKYNFDNLESGRELSDTDLEMMAPVAEFAWANNVPQDVLTGMMDRYLAEADKVFETMQAQDNLDMQEFTELAKKNWGGEYEINMNRITNRLNLLPEAVRDSFKQARMPDGRGIMSSPEIMTWLVGMDREITPLNPMQGGTESTLADARQIVAKAKDRMANDREAWFKDLDAQREFQAAQEMIDRAEGSQ